MTPKIPVNNYANYFDPSKAHHLSFLQALLDRVDRLDPAALQPGGDLRDIWVAAVETKAPSPTPNASAPSSPSTPLADPSQAAVTWESMMAMARGAGAKFPELVAAQGALESGWYKEPSGANNYFGLKGKGTTKQTKEFTNGKWVTISDSFIDFSTPQAAVNYLVERWYKNFEKYKGVNNAKSRDDAARMLVSEGYATDPNYAAKLIRIMNEKAPVKQEASKLPLQQTIGRHGNPLSVPWYSQLDSATNQGRRMCFSSSCAMLLAYLKPGTLIGPNGDDQYLERVMTFGDTTDSRAQVLALQSYGLKASFLQSANFETIEKQIDAGVPVPCGFIHRGPVDRPTGSGHWLIVIGYTETELIVHDPLGESNLVTGATINSIARYCKYSKKNFGKRWMVQAAGGGAYRYSPNKGWAIMSERLN
jgi:hypothetical protein